MHEAYIRIVPDSRKAVVLIHGICGTPAHFDMLLPLIPADWSVYNLLLPGHGGEVRDFARSSMTQWRETVEDTLAEVLKTHDRVVLVAHSMGTLFAVQQAVKHPGQVQGMLFLGCPLRVKYPPSTLWLTLRTAWGIGSDPAVEAMRRCCGIRLTPWLWRYIGWAPRFVELLGEVSATRKLLPRLSTPCKCFQSQGDELVSLRAVADLRQNPCIDLTVLPHSTHFYYDPQDLPQIQSALLSLLRNLQ
jgi:carboxylesterase